MKKSQIYWVPGEKISITWGNKTAEVDLMPPGDSDPVAPQKPPKKDLAPERKEAPPGSRHSKGEPVRPMPKPDPGVMAFVLLTTTGRLKVVAAGDNPKASFIAFYKELTKVTNERLVARKHARRMLHQGLGMAGGAPYVPPMLKTVTTGAPEVLTEMPKLNELVRASPAGVLGVQLVASPSRKK